MPNRSITVQCPFPEKYINECDRETSRSNMEMNKQHVGHGHGHGQYTAVASWGMTYMT